jgi:hypothetical protein
VLGANTYRQFVDVLGPSAEEAMVDDPVNTRMMSLPTTVVSTTLQGPLAWPNATPMYGDAVDVIRRMLGLSSRRRPGLWCRWGFL